MSIHLYLLFLLFLLLRVPVADAADVVVALASGGGFGFFCGGFGFVWTLEQVCFRPVPRQPAQVSSQP